MSFLPTTPKFVNTGSGDVRLNDPGIVRLEAAAALPKQMQGEGGRRYNWMGEKITIIMKGENLAELAAWRAEMGPLELGYKSSNGAISSFRLAGPGYTGMGSAIATVQRTADGRTATVEVALTRGELALLQNVSNYVVPRLYGLDVAFEQPL